ncbi:MAG TPA: DUF3011 domain-containing protein [Vicinamibacterales bacterium]|nr:DUF3011 domain-containing protein [Vicinamibacterales bacterium]
MAGVLCVSLLAVWPARAQERTIRCESHNFRYRYCSADTDNRVTLVRQRSNTRCKMWVNWGYDKRGVWVDRGCAAEFRVGRDDSGSGTAVAAGAAVAAVAVAAAIAANRDRNHSDVPSWSIGTFSGYDARENADVEVTIVPGGSVTGSAGSQRFTGTMDGNRLEAGRYHFRVERSGNGFTATDERDSSHRVVFRRTGSGYGS